MNNLSNLWISAYWRQEPFQTIQSDLVNWFEFDRCCVTLVCEERTRAEQHVYSEPRAERTARAVLVLESRPVAGVFGSQVH